MTPQRSSSNGETLARPTCSETVIVSTLEKSSGGGGGGAERRSAAKRRVYAAAEVADQEMKGLLAAKSEV